MDLLRLIAGAVAAGALAACTVAGAQATERPTERSGLTAPAGWRELPELVDKLHAALAGQRLRLAGADAWGEPARGCYAVWLAVRGEGASVKQVLAGLAGADLATAEVVTPPADGDGVVTATFAQPPYQGRLRARVAPGRITALACFANAREPAACATPCTLLLGSLP